MIKEPHGPDSARARQASTEPHRRPRGFTAIELAVSLGIFLVLGTVMTIAISRSLGAGSEVQVSRASEAAASDMLSVLANYSYDDLVKGSFTVPEPCPDSASGISGTSCVKAAGVPVRVRYFYQLLDTSGQTRCPDVAGGFTGPTDGQQMATAVKSVGLCAVAVDEGGNLSRFAVISKRSVNAPVADYVTGQAKVRVFVSGDTNQPGFPTGLYLVRALDPSQMVAASESMTAGAAEFIVNPTNQCTSSDPCAVALAPATAPLWEPSSIGDLGLFGSAASPEAHIVSAAGVPVDVSVSVGPVAKARVGLDGNGTAPSLAGTVCLDAWTTIKTKSARECNLDDAAVVSFTRYQVMISGQAYRYPLAPGAQLVVEVDSPNGTCAPGGRSPDSSGVWSATSTCTSWVWGQAQSLPSSLTLRAFNDPATGADATAHWDAGTPAGGLTPGANPWTLPRMTPGCASDDTCSPVEQSPEDAACPGKSCLSLGGTQ